jgi:pectate lyase
MKSKDQIKNFVLNIALWQVENFGFSHRMSMHIQDVIPNFVINWLRVDNGVLSFDGLKFDTERNMWIDNQNIKASEITQEQLDKILDILKSIDFFKP